MHKRWLQALRTRQQNENNFSIRTFLRDICSNGQVTTHVTSRSSTAKFSGTYSFGTSVEKGRVGQLLFIPNPTALFILC